MKMKKIIYVNSLSHHGVKGMKWGVRKESRPSHKDIRSERDKYALSITKSVNDKVGYTKASDRFENFISKYGVDADDGGGGDKPLTKKQYQQYEKLSRESELTGDRANREISKRTTQHLINKYGEKRYSQFKRSESFRNGAKATGIVLGIVAATPVIVVGSPLIVGGAYVSYKIKLSKQKRRESHQSSK